MRYALPNEELKTYSEINRLTRKTKLSASMTVTQFDHGYWYTTELKHFAKGLGIPSASKLRATKEQAIKAWSMVKAMDIPKTYSAWVRARSRKSRNHARGNS